MAFVMPFLPPLPHAEICELARRYQKTGDPAALDRMVRSHLGLAHKFAYMHRFPGVEIDDLLAEAYAGLVVAAQKFDPDNGAQLQTYAVPWIRAYLLRFGMAFQGPVRFGSEKKARYAMFAILASGKKQGLGNDPDTWEEIAKAIDAPVELVRAVGMRLQRYDISLDTPTRRPGLDSSRDTLADVLPDTAPLPDEIAMRRQEIEQTRARVAPVLAKLDPRERRIAQDRFMRDEPRTLEAIGKTYGISRERVRQLETRVRRRLASALA